MPRKPRIEFEGAFYYVITRGNQRQKIFREFADYQKYLQFLTIYKNRYHYSLYAYVFMSNHVHLLIETSEVPLSTIMQGINQRYTMHFNRKYHTVGHLFQGRYKALLCDRDNHLLALLKYIHHNPIRAKIVERLDSYLWSSHAYTGKANPLGLTDIDHVLHMFSERKGVARKRYREYMSAGGGIDKAQVYAAVDQRFLGDEAFVERVLEQHDKETEPRMKRKPYRLERIAQVIESLYEVSQAVLRSSTRARPVTFCRRLFSYAAREYGYKGIEVATYLKVEPAAVTSYDKSREELVGALKEVMRRLESNKT